MRHRSGTFVGTDPPTTPGQQVTKRLTTLFVLTSSMLLAASPALAGTTCMG